MDEIETNDPEPQVQEVVNKKSVQEIAQEVVAGRWSRGNMRSKRLIEAGYNPDEVAAEVDKIFKG